MRAQLITAFEVSRAASDQAGAYANNPVIGQLVQDSVNVTINLRRQVKVFSRSFWLEIHALIAVAAILGAMLLFDAVRPEIPSAPPVGLPQAGQEPSADAVLPPDPTLQQPPLPPQQVPSQAQLRDILQILADALRDQAITFAIAQAIDRDELDRAAEELRRLADQLDELSVQARTELGDSLQEAADNIGRDAPNVTEPLQSGAEALDIKNLSGASRALEDLAQVLEELDEAVSESEPSEDGSESNESGEAEAADSSEAPAEAEEEGGAGEGTGEGGDSDQGPGEAEDRLPIDGQPLELESDLESDNRVLQPAELDAETGEERTLDSPFTRQPLNAAGEDLGPDPLTYPWEKREIIRRYFTP
jgi:hypothetical protein